MPKKETLEGQSSIYNREIEIDTAVCRDFDAKGKGTDPAPLDGYFKVNATSSVLSTPLTLDVSSFTNSPLLLLNQVTRVIPPDSHSVLMQSNSPASTLIFSSLVFTSEFLAPFSGFLSAIFSVVLAISLRSSVSVTSVQVASHRSHP